MSGGGRKKRTEKKEDDGDEVEKLLRATEDDILLKLSVDSHMSRGSSSQILDPDLDLRFRALRSNSKPTNPASKSNQNPPIISSTNLPDLKPNQAVVVDGNDDDDDLFARFAALKSSLPSYNTSTFSAVNNSNQVLPKSEEDEEGEDEVDKVIRWAMDSARLDPSPTSDADTDVDDDDNSDTSDESDDDIGDGKMKGKKRK